MEETAIHVVVTVTTTSRVIRMDIVLVTVQTLGTGYFHTVKVTTECLYAPILYL
jgi:hypothetical protein